MGEKKRKACRALCLRQAPCQQELLAIVLLHQFCCCCYRRSPLSGRPTFRMQGQAGRNLVLALSSALTLPPRAMPRRCPGKLAMRPPEFANLVEFTARVYSRRLGHFKLSYCGLASLRLRIPQNKSRPRRHSDVRTYLTLETSMLFGLRVANEVRSMRRRAFLFFHPSCSPCQLNPLLVSIHFTAPPLES